MRSYERPGSAVTLVEARDQLLASLTQLQPRFAALDECLGCVLAESVVANEDVPSFASAAVDGFAVRAEDTEVTPIRLRLAGRVTAGGMNHEMAEPGTAIAIATGAPVPDGTNAVCMVEHSFIDGNEVVLDAPVSPGANIRFPGEDVVRGSIVFQQRSVIRSSHIGVLTSLGFSGIKVYPKVRVGVLTTGDELQTEPGPLAQGHIHDSNRHSLLAAVAESGNLPVDLGVVGDDATLIAHAIEAGLGICDVIFTTGGVSVGAADHMKTVLSNLSAPSIRWMEIAIKPAKPFGFAILPSGLPVICMPGNPVAALVSFELLGRPALRHMAGHRILSRPVVLAIAEDELPRKPDGKLHFVRVILRIDKEGNLRARLSGPQGPHQLRSMALANGLAVLPDGEGVGAGQRMHVMITDYDDLQGSGSWT